MPDCFRKPKYLCVLTLLVVASCGRGSSLVPGTPDVRLAIDVDVQSSQRQATLECASGAAAGTGFLAGDGRAGAACAALDVEAKRRLLTEPQPDRMCTEVYGGPQKATVTGTIRGATVNATIGRTNGCGIGDWQALEALLGRPE